mmetsp:Transcript_77360/g.90114  ORF Transcript_77360/g.90114 Transcript_77360/m.90114 type:complete len:244 (-) Transcript_77360:12-743(-)
MKQMTHRRSDSPVSTNITRTSTKWMLPRSASTDCSSSAVLPKNVFSPVYCTVPSTSPRTTVEPIFGMWSTLIVTGSDSPVSAASSTSIWPSLIEQSAGTADPDASFTMSPGTTSAASMFCHLPSRYTVASGFSELFSAATASPAFVVSYQPIVAFANWMNSRMPPSGKFCSENSMITAIQIAIGIGPHRHFRKMIHPGVDFSGSSLRPWIDSRRSASADVRPCDGGSSGWSLSLMWFVVNDMQ